MYSHISDLNCITHFIYQAILSQFSRKLKKKPNDNDEDEEPEDPVDIATGRQLNALEDEINGVGFGDEELEVDSDGHEDEVAGDVAASDALAVDEAILEADMSLRLDPLPADQANIGRISIAKVRVH